MKLRDANHASSFKHFAFIFLEYVHHDYLLFHDYNIFRKYKCKVVIYLSEADLELVKLVVMTNVFFNNHQRETEIKVWFLHQQLKSTFSWYMQNVKTDLYRKLRFQPNLLVQRRK